MASAVVFRRQNDNRMRFVASCKHAFTQFCMHGFEQSLAGLFVLFVLKGPTKDCSKSCGYLHDCKKVEKLNEKLIFFVSWTVGHIFMAFHWPFAHFALGHISWL